MVRSRCGFEKDVHEPRRERAMRVPVTYPSDWLNSPWLANRLFWHAPLDINNIQRQKLSSISRKIRIQRKKD
jgi:hypothetical protein